MKRRLLVICPYPVGVAPSQRLKYEQYFDSWKDSGIDVTVSPFMTRRFWTIAYQPGRVLEKIFWTLVGYLVRVRDLVRAGRFDGVYVTLWVTPFGPPLFERLLAAANRNLVYDIDDMIFLGHSSRANRAIEWLKGRRKMLYLMRAAKHVIVCTPKLDAFVQQLNPRTTDISSTIDTRAYAPPVAHTEKPRVTIGWSGSHSTSKYLKLIEGPLRRVCDATGAEVLVIGDPDFRFDSLPCTAMKWQSATEVDDLRRIDVGVYPLPDEEWVYGKSGLKALQYMALGIPPVATAIGANHRVIEDQRSGFLVTTEDEWVDRLTQLVRDAQLRARLGEAGRQRVRDLYSIDANKETYLGVLRSVMG